MGFGVLSSTCSSLFNSANYVRPSRSYHSFWWHRGGSWTLETGRGDVINCEMKVKTSLQPVAGRQGRLREVAPSALKFGAKP